MKTRNWMIALVLIPVLALADGYVYQGPGSPTNTPWSTDSSAKFTGATTEVLVLNLTQTAMPTTPLAGRRAIEIQNLGPNAIYCAIGPASTPPTAVLLKSRQIAASGGVWAIDLNDKIIVRCLVATANQVTGAATIVTEVR